MHIGIDTVKLKGQYYEAHVQNEQRVKKGDLLISFDIDAIKNAGFKVTTPMIICNTYDYGTIEAVASGAVKVGNDLLKIEN